MIADFHTRIRSRAPLRISFAGGGTELPEFIRLYGGHIVSSTISKYAYTSIKLNTNQNEIQLNGIDVRRHYSIELDKIEYINHLNCGPLPLHEATIKYFLEHFKLDLNNGIELSTYCDAPEGSGLGSSSTLTVSIIKALSLFFGISLDSYKVANIAYQIERNFLKFAGGLQDHYSASFGGLNFIDFKSDGNFVVNPLRLNDSQKAEFESWLCMFYTGKSRNSGKVIEEQIRLLKSGDKKIIENLQKTKDMTSIFKDLILKGNFKELGHEMHLSWERKKNLSNDITNEEIDTMYNFARSNGAIGGKLSGAGGGGYLLLVCPPDEKIKMLNSMKKLWPNLNGENVSLSDESAMAWTV